MKKCSDWFEVIPILSRTEMPIVSSDQPEHKPIWDLCHRSVAQQSTCFTIYYVHTCADIMLTMLYECQMFARSFILVSCKHSNNFNSYAGLISCRSYVNRAL